MVLTINRSEAREKAEELMDVMHQSLWFLNSLVEETVVGVDTSNEDMIVILEEFTKIVKESGWKR